MYMNMIFMLFIAMSELIYLINSTLARNGCHVCELAIKIFVLIGFKILYRFSSFKSSI
jgi:hypothetical protein